jgi:hypothetical protein
MAFPSPFPSNILKFPSKSFSEITLALFPASIAELPANR